MIDPIIIAAIVYANSVTLLSIGFTLTYMGVKVPNFAHGTLAVLGSYVCFTVYLYGHSPYLSLPMAFLVTGSLSLFLYKGIIGVLKAHGASLISLTISTLAMEIMMVSWICIYVDYIETHAHVHAYNVALKTSDFEFLGLPGILMSSTIIAVISILSLHLMLTKTKFGIAMRACLENSSLAEVLGVDVELVIAVSWFLTGGLNGLAGAMLPLWFRVNVFEGSRIQMTIFAASVTGGLSSIYGTILGGYIIGLSEIFLTNVLVMVLGLWIAPYRPLIPLLVMIIMLLTMPGGITKFLNRIKVK